MKRKFIEERIFRGLMLFSVAVVLFFVLSVIFSVFKRGIPVLTWEMITSLGMRVEIVKPV